LAKAGNESLTGLVLQRKRAFLEIIEQKFLAGVLPKSRSAAVSRVAHALSGTSRSSQKSAKIF
jgi:hypothetical protein